MVLPTFYFGLMILLTILLIGYHGRKIYGEISGEVFIIRSIAPHLFSVIGYLIAMIFFFQMFTGWKGQYIIPIRNIHEEVIDGTSSSFLILIVILVSFLFVITSFRGSISVLKLLVTRKISDQNRESMQLVLLMAFVAIYMQHIFLPIGLPGTVNQVYNEFRQIQKAVHDDSYQSKLASASMVRGSISDKYTCVSCSHTDSSLVWIGRIPVSTPAETNNLYLFRVNDTVFSVSKQVWEQLRIGNTVKVYYKDNEVLNVTSD